NWFFLPPSHQKQYKKKKKPPPGGGGPKKKGPASKNIGDEQLSLLRLLAGKVPHELRMLRDLF
uniref:hypothetical protein n=1 Tax=Shigella flexneri TaxID=623 RepID=UPI001C0A7B86